MKIIAVILIFIIIAIVYLAMVVIRTKGRVDILEQQITHLINIANTNHKMHNSIQDFMQFTEKDIERINDDLAELEARLEAYYNRQMIDAWQKRNENDESKESTIGEE